MAEDARPDFAVNGGDEVVGFVDDDVLHRKLLVFLSFIGVEILAGEMEGTISVLLTALAISFMPQMQEERRKPAVSSSPPAPSSPPSLRSGEYAAGVAGRRGVAGRERAGAARGRLALRCPALATQPDGSGIRC